MTTFEYRCSTCNRTTIAADLLSVCPECSSSDMSVATFDDPLTESEQTIKDAEKELKERGEPLFI